MGVRFFFPLIHRPEHFFAHAADGLRIARDEYHLAAGEPFDLLGELGIGEAFARDAHDSIGKRDRHDLVHV